MHTYVLLVRLYIYMHVFLCQNMIKTSIVAHPRCKNTHRTWNVLGSNQAKLFHCQGEVLLILKAARDDDTTDYQLFGSAQMINFLICQ